MDVGDTRLNTVELKERQCIDDHQLILIMAILRDLTPRLAEEFALGVARFPATL
jgi:hypothetical protein